MILNHLGLIRPPVEEWQTIDNRHESLLQLIAYSPHRLYSQCNGLLLRRTLRLACRHGRCRILTHNSAMLIAVAMYVA